MKHQGHLLVFAILMISVICGEAHLQRRPVCACTCPFNKLTICDTVEGLRNEAAANSEQLLIWARYRDFVMHFSDRWRQEIADVVETTIKEYISKGKLYGKPENIFQKLEDDMQNDSIMILNPFEDDSDLAKNVSNLMEKVEKVENRTREVEKELKTERRVRRDLEEKVNKTHSSLVYIEDQLQNVSAPVDAMVTQVEMKLFSSIEDLNKTIYEEHLKKLYYKFDGVAYKNETEKLDERLETVEIELHGGSNSSVVSQLAEDLKNLEENLYLLNNSIGAVVVSSIQTLNSSIGDVLIPRIETLESEVVRKDETDELENKMTNLLNDTEMFKIALLDVLLKVQDVQDLEKKFQNFSEELTKSLEAIKRRIEHLKNETIVRDIADQGEIIPTFTPYETESTSTVFATVNVTDFESNDVAEFETNDIAEFKTNDIDEISTIAEEPAAFENDFSTVDYRSRIDGSNLMSCDVPVIDDPHLLVDVVQSDRGEQTLKFGCKPIGLYTVPRVPVPARCEEGSWRIPISSCMKLSNATTIETLAGELLKENPCDTGSGEFPDRTNCSQFFKCAHGKRTVFFCPSGLHFNAMIKICDYPKTAACYPEKVKYVEELQNLIPPIHIEPSNLDRPYSHLGTGGTGELIVHPRSSFTLHCVYPESMYGNPNWNVTYLHPGAYSRVLSLSKGVNRVSLTLTSAKEEDSGMYRCLTPFGLEHGIEVIVKNITCPAFPMEPDYEDVFYRPTPEGELRILGTTAEVQCEEGHKVTAQCMANGTWSKAFPSEQGCTPKKRSDEKNWNCTPLDANRHPNLILERNNDERIITFKCASPLRLIGNSFIRCLDDGSWSHTSLPVCRK